MKNFDKDFDKVYNEDDLNQMLVSDFHKLKMILEHYCNKILSDEEKLQIKQAEEIIYALYHYAINSDFYKMGKENEAVAQEQNISNILNEANKIQIKLLANMPPNMLKTSFAMKKSYLKWKK